MRVLVLEDDEAARRTFSLCLEDAGHTVVSCDSLACAYKSLRTSKVELLILDLFIGDGNSLGLAQYAGYAAPDAEIIIVTGSGRFAHGELLAEYPGVSWVLRKPLPVGDLEAIVNYAQTRAA
ncbi:response regulator [uncultured Roseobacter sp.]|uniref:response regulator n=1 Tax=uncultured Roseobacter sp. TaxID=114847 RepID=UPI0026202BB1|nr:response regulator [uncultured Roseobacter sp.]